jgi:exodeoxyribonuclease VII large subunit
MTSPAIELPVLSVSGLTQSIKMLLEGQFSFVAVQGEVSNCKLQASGHLYFSIKDANAQLSAVMFKGDLAKVPRLPKDGDQVILKGGLNVYPPSGKYQIVVRTLEWAGVGALLLQLEALKAKLKGLGYFDSGRKKPLPKFPKTIGVVTSPTGAVIQDILNVLERRISEFHLILNPVKVQGPGASQEIAAAIDFFNKHQLADVLIVGRGGGSLEDLWAFNEEVVAAAIFRSQIPVVSAVGHETDFTLADFVADVRAPREPSFKSLLKPIRPSPTLSSNSCGPKGTSYLPFVNCPS